jgi:hypothetical protein
VQAGANLVPTRPTINERGQLGGVPRPGPSQEPNPQLFRLFLDVQVTGSSESPCRRRPSLL